MHKHNDNIKMDHRGLGYKAGTGFSWLRIESTGGLLWTWKWTFGLDKRWGISWPSEWLTFFMMTLHHIHVLDLRCYIIIVLKGKLGGWSSGFIFYCKNGLHI